MKKKRDVRRYPLNQCAFYRCQSRKRLAKIFFTDESEMEMILDLISYHKFFIPKKNSEEKREITAPDKILKRVQLRIFNLISSIERPNWLMSGEKGKSYITNAKYHRENQYCFTTDISKFYDNCKRGYVYCFFTKSMQCSPDVAKILTDLTTYNGGIPTGTSTSQLIAYYAYEKMFNEIYELSVRYSLKFSLYVDDMTFSSNTDFPHKKFLFELNGILRHYGHSVKTNKTKYYSANDFKVITGVGIRSDGSISVQNCKRKQIIEDFYACKAQEGNENKLCKKLCGRVSSAKQIQPNIFPEIEHKAKIWVKKSV